MKLKEKECNECGYFGEVIKGLCRKCYWQNLRIKSAKKSIAKSKKKVGISNKELDKWFDIQITQIPKECENCNDKLAYHKQAHPRWTIAHILPKRNNMFPEVATHPLNRVFLCPNCHQDFDNKGSGITEMKVFNIALKRLKKVTQKLSKKQYERIPEYYLKRIRED